MRTYQKQINKKKTSNKLLNKTAGAKSPALKHKSKVINTCFVVSDGVSQIVRAAHTGASEWSERKKRGQGHPEESRLMRLS